MRGQSTSPQEVQRRRARFCAAYAETGDATAAAIAAGFAPKNADVQASRLMRDASIGPRARAMREARAKEQADDFARQQAALRTAADGAISTLVDVATAAPRSPDGKPDRAHHLGAMARVQAAVAILDRAGHKPIERVEQSVTWSDISRELDGVNVAQVLQDALDAISASPDAQPGDSTE